MRFEISFDPAVFTAKNELKFKILVRKILKRAGFLLIVGAALLLWSLGAWVVGREVDQFTLWAGIVFCYLGILNFIAYRKQRRLFRHGISAASTLRNKARDTKVYEFAEEYFRFEDMLYDLRYKWAAFKYYRVIERTLLLYLREATSDDFFMISEAELGHEASKEVMKFVATKLKVGG
jgi:hypothetical protein